MGPFALAKSVSFEFELGASTLGSHSKGIGGHLRPRPIMNMSFEFEPKAPTTPTTLTSPETGHSWIARVGCAIPRARMPKARFARSTRHMLLGRCLGAAGRRAFLPTASAQTFSRFLMCYAPSIGAKRSPQSGLEHRPTGGRLALHERRNRSIVPKIHLHHIETQLFLHTTSCP